MFFRRHFYTAVLLLISGNVFAQDFGFFVGYRSDSAHADVTNADLKSGSSFSFGAIGRFEVSERLGFRTGMQYIPRQYEWEQGGLADRLRMTYFEIPATLLYYFTEGGGVFLGPSFSFNLDKDCGTLVCSGVSSNILWMQLGASFKFAPQLGVEVFFEQSLGTPIKTHVTNPRAVGFNFFVIFE